MKVYIAFSIHGTNSFRVATKRISRREFEALQEGGTFTVAISRRPDHSESRDGVKLHWDKLKRKDGTPLQNKGWVSKRFNELAEMGWRIVK